MTFFKKPDSIKTVAHFMIFAALLIIMPHGYAHASAVGGLLGGSSATNFAAIGSNITSNSSCGQGTLGGMVCNIMAGTVGLPALVTGLAYLMGLICGFLGILKLREHVDDPRSVPIWDPMKRFLAGGSFFALPLIVSAVKTTIEGGSSSYFTNNHFKGASSGAGLDAMIYNLVKDLLTPMTWAVGWVGWLGGLIFVFIGISRLLKSEQDGPKGPTGIGTLVTFLVAGALFSLNSMIVFLNTSLFGNAAITSYGALQYTAGLGGSVNHVHAVISAIVGFSMIIGWISLLRGLFIVRGVAEGNSQASMMAAITHLIGGALAINLGGVINAVQSTLGITPFGIIFS